MSRVTATRATADDHDTAAPTDRQWAGLSARLTATVGVMSGRDDVIARIAPGLGCGAPAAFVIPIAQIEVDPAQCLPEGTNPDHVDPRTPSGRRAHPVLVGACAHEAGHAAYSRWVTPAGSGAAAASAAGLLEETRMEGRYVAGRPVDRVWLQASTAELVAGCDPESAEPAPLPWSAARLAALLCARADAGVLDHDKVAPVEGRVREIVGDDTFEQLRGIWLEAHACADDDAEGMIALGARWCETLGVDPDGPDPDGTVSEMSLTGDGEGEDPSSDPTDGDGDGPGSTGSGDSDPADGDDTATSSGDSDTGQANDEATQDGRTTGDAGLDDAVTDALADTTTTAEDQIAGGYAASHARAEREARTREVVAKDRDRSVEAATRVMNGTLDRGTSTNIARSREPNSAERSAAVRLGRALDEARYRARGVSKINTACPPGRVQFSAAMELDRQTAMGLVETAKPYRAKVFTPQAEPDPKVAILCDVSGSMDSVTGAVASTAWILGEAAHRVNAKVTTLIFGNGVAPLTKPGERARKVREFTASDGTEEIAGALSAADGLLGLTTGTGPRLVFVVSDAYFVGDGQMSAARAKIKALAAAGVVVVWVPFGYYDEHALPGAQVAVAPSTDELGTVIARTVLEAVRSAA